MTAPRRLAPGDPALAAVLALIRDSFAFMDGVIDPPSSMHGLTLADLDRQAATAEVWATGDPPVACVVLTPRADALHVGKLAVAASQRGRGHARALVDLAATRARIRRLPALELQVRIELAANQAAFARMGFVETARTAHPGYDRPTSLTFRRAVPPR
jgi:ribosomal protein S18 acetylase RimI-like enzyme